MSIKFPVIIEPEEAGGYSVYCPTLPGCFSMGQTKEEALSNIKEAIECHIESLRKDGLPIPQTPVEPIIAEVEVSV